MTSTSWMPLAATTAIVFSGTLVRAVSGLGFSLVAVPLLSLVWSPAQAVAIAVLFQTLSTLPIVAGEYRLLDWRLLARICAGGVVGMVPGLALMQWLPEPAMRVALASILLLSIGIIVAGRRLIRTMTPSRLMVVGVCAGVAQGMAGVSGPPLMAGLMATPGLEPRQARLTATSVFLLLGMVSVTTLGMRGAFGVMSVSDYAIAGVGMIGGHMAGERLFALGGADGFRRYVLLVLCASALLTLAPLWR
ncbi:sulfite exporter TauE/SafE family protein [Cupriavidus sp.]|uniref:sulfite exporter TauE/SafE family protein n=1 Tax=Cupriavidus sp. TaxID=1873897 RepID=UPI0028BDE51B|nr:sulfite exporter TauE/SafE family protein [Cupriavidus sp.]